MVAVMLMRILAVAGLCVLAYTLAVYALPFMLGVTAAQFAYHTGAGFIGAGLVGFAAAVAGYALVHGVTEDAVPSEIWRQVFCILGGAFVFVSALTRLAGGMGQPAKEGMGTGWRAFS